MEPVLTFSWAQTLLLPYVLRICLFEQEPNDEMCGLRWLSAGDTVSLTTFPHSQYAFCRLKTFM